MIKFFKKKHLLQRTFITQTFVFLVVFSSCSEHKSSVLKPSEEVLQIRKPVVELYQNLKVEDGKAPNFEFIYSLFTETANLGYVKEDNLILKSPQEYFSGMQGGIDSGIVKLLHEWEINGETAHFGDIAHHRSTYGVYFGTTDSIAERGVTSFQLVKLKGDWKIQSMIWKAENVNLRIPENYLKN